MAVPTITAIEPPLSGGIGTRAVGGYPHREKPAMTKLDRITIEPGKMNGQPCIRGMRITVKRVLLALAAYPSRVELFRAFPDLEEEDIRQALEYAAASLEDRVDALTTVR